jgi:hypothetical protein
MPAPPPPARYRPLYWHGRVHLHGDAGLPGLGQFVYAHELAHTLDGDRDDYSGTPAWRRAFISDLYRKVSCRYGEHPDEGFACVVGLLYAGTEREKLRRKYPRCMAYLEGRLRL